MPFQDAFDIFEKEFCRGTGFTPVEHLVSMFAWFLTSRVNICSCNAMKAAQHTVEDLIEKKRWVLTPGWVSPRRSVSNVPIIDTRLVLGITIDFYPDLLDLSTPLSNKTP